MGEFKQKNRRAPHWGKFLNRLNILLVIVFALFAVLIMRLGYVQLVRGDAFTHLVQMTDTNIAKVGVPRGYITDRNGKLLVDNEGLQAISYTRGQDVSATDMAKTADKLATFIEMDTENLTDRDKKDYFAAKHMDELNDRLSKDEKKLSEDEVYDAQIKHISDDELDFSDEEKEAAAIFKKMNSAYAFTPTLIKNQEVTSEEVAKISEHNGDLPGVTASMDWKRTYPKNDLLRSVLGNVTTTEEGLPQEDADKYLAKGYARNDRVGDSYLELQYEDILRGSKAIYETEVNQNGEVVRQEQTYPGEIGDTLVLTIDSEIQEKLEKYAEDYLNSRTVSTNNQMYMVVTDPNTGNVIALVGKRRDEDGNIIDDALGTINSSFIMGSAIKGATVAAGYQYGIITPENNTLVDEPLNFAGTPTKASWWYTFNKDSSPKTLSDEMALARSSNVYMIKLAMAIGGLNNYYSGMDLSGLSDETSPKLRAVYNQYGLGVKTGIDLENESPGINGGIPDNPGNALDLAFGQFDTFTPISLNQYVATIANGGKRIAPHVLKEVREGEDSKDHGRVVYSKEPKVLNKVKNTPEQIQRIQEGFYQQINNSEGLGYDSFEGFPIKIAGKSGTAETNEGENHSWVGYAPYDNPKYAVSIVTPGINQDAQSSNVQDIGRDVFEIVLGLNNQSNDQDNDDNNDSATTDTDQTTDDSVAE